MMNFITRYGLQFTGFLLLLCTGCHGRQAVVAATGTVIGVEISQNPQTQMYQAKLGYNRGEMAIVPSNRSGNAEPGCVGGGAKDTADVIMELKYSGLFSSSGGIYQRLAVGTTAVKQPGAAFMFAKDDSGKLEDAPAQAVAKALQGIQETPADVEKARAPLAKAYTQLVSTKADVFNAAAITQGYHDFRDFMLNRPKAPTMNQVQNIRAELEKDEVIKAKIAEFDSE
jgi:hypothetical protein